MLIANQHGSQLFREVQAHVGFVQIGNIRPFARMTNVFALTNEIFYLPHYMYKFVNGLQKSFKQIKYRFQFAEMR